MDLRAQNLAAPFVVKSNVSDAEKNNVDDGVTVSDTLVVRSAERIQPAVEGLLISGHRASIAPLAAVTAKHLTQPIADSSTLLPTTYVYPPDVEEQGSFEGFQALLCPRKSTGSRKPASFEGPDILHSGWR